MRLSGYLLLSLYLLSCHSKNQDSKLIETTSIHKSFILEKLDSIQIDYLGTPTVHDIDPISEIVLFMEHKESDQIILTANFQGKVLSNFSKWGDTQGSYGNLMAPLKIIDEDTFLAFASRGFLTYNFEGDLQSLIKHSDELYIGFNRMGMGVGMERMFNFYIYINLESNQKLKNGSEDYVNLRPLIRLNPSSGETKEIIKIPESSIFLSGKYFFKNAWDPSFTVTNDEIVLAFGLEPKLYFFNNNEPYSLIKELPLDLPEYKYFKGMDNYTPDDVRFFGQARTSAKILNIKILKGFIIVVYFPGFDAIDIDQSFENKPPTEAKEFWNHMRTKYPDRIAVFDSLGNRLCDFVSESLILRSMLLRNGELWMLEKPDEELERDYFRLFKVGLKIGK